MTTVVLDSKDLVKSLETGEIPVPPEVAADRAGPKAAKEVEAAKDEVKVEAKVDDEDENGLTETQKRDFTEAMKRTISKKHRQIKEAEEFAAAQYSERRLAEERASNAEKALKELQQKAEPAKPVEDAKPVRENFKTEEAYQDAVIDYKVDQRLIKEKREAIQKAEQEAQAKVIEAAKSQIARAIELVPDYAEITDAAETIVPLHIGQYMQLSDKFAELGYYFAKNPDELVKLSSMPAKNFADVMRVGIALDKISSKLTSFSESKPDGSQSKANGSKSHETESATGSASPSTKTESDSSVADPSKPRESAPVIRPLNAGSANQVEKSPSERSTREEIAAWQRQKQANLGVRKRH